MKVKLDNLRDEEIILTEDIPSSNWEMDSFDVQFIDDIHLECTFKRLGKEILVTCNASTPMELTCSRCLDKVRKTTEHEITLSYNVANLGEELEVDKDVREEVLLNYPMRVLCKPDCKGMCSGCGANLNTEECKCKVKPEPTEEEEEEL